jgi:hypothetical protein
MNDINALHMKQAGIVFFFGEKTLVGPVYTLKAFQSVSGHKLG